MTGSRRLLAGLDGGGLFVLDLSIPAVAPSITTQAASQTIASGQTATMTRRGDRHGDAQLSVVRRREREHGEPDRRRDVEQLHDAGAVEHDQLLGARDEPVSARRLEHRRSSRW